MVDDASHSQALEQPYLSRFIASCGARTDYALDAERLLHLFAHSRQSFDAAAADFCGGPTAPTDIIETLSNLIPWEIIFGGGDIDEFIFGSAKTLHIELHCAMAKSVEPFAWLSVLPAIPDVIVHTDPRALKAIDELDKARRLLLGRRIVVVVHLIPNVFEQDRLAERRGEWEKFFNLVSGTIIDFGLGTISSSTDHNQHTAATDRMGNAKAMGNICDTRFSILFVGAGEPLVPVIMVDRIVAKDT